MLLQMNLDHALDNECTPPPLISKIYIPLKPFLRSFPPLLYMRIRIRIYRILFIRSTYRTNPHYRLITIVSLS